MPETVGACSLDCPDGCSWIVTTDDAGVPVKLRGNPDHPFTRGGLCSKVNPYLEYAARPDRLLYPQRRIGQKGDGRFERITWDDALSEIAARFREAIDTHGAEAIWPFAGTGSVGILQGAPGVGKRLFHRLGASRHLGTICSVAGHVGMSHTTGSAYGMDPEDVVHAGLVLLWGTNTLTTNQHLWPFVQEARAGGAEVVVIDPLRTRTAARADHHVQLMPGTDGALALGIMAELVRSGRVDRAWLDENAHGWDAFEHSLAQWSSRRAAAVCGLDIEDVDHMVELIGTRSPVAIRTSMGVQRHAGGGQAARVLSCLPAVTGDYARRGGGICYSTSPAYGFDYVALNRPDLQPGPTRSLASTRLGHGLLDVDDPPVTVLMMWGANPVVANPDETRVRAALGRDDLFTVVVDHVHTDTTAYADIVLPGTTQLEHEDLHDSFSHLYVQWNNPVVAPPGECRSHTEIFRNIATAMGLDDPELHASDDELARAALGGGHPSVAGIDVDRLRRVGWARLGDTGRLPFAAGFPTVTGRFEFTSERAAAAGHGRLPHYVPPAEAATGPVGTLALVSPANHHVLNSTFAGSPRHQRAGVHSVELHPDDASHLGVADGEKVVVANDRGSFHAVAVVNATGRRGVAATTKGRVPAPTGVNATVAERDADMGQGAVYHDNRVTIRLAVEPAANAG